jgi:serine/threonine-protein kinase RsbW
MTKPAGFKVKAILENIPRAMACVRNSAQSAGFAGKQLCQIEMAVDEACANVVDHAYEQMEVGDMEVSCSLNEQDLIICVRDWGRSFNLDEIPDPDVEAPLEDRTLGGLGLYLIKQIMDRVQYTADPEAGNVLLMVKKRKCGPITH